MNKWKNQIESNTQDFIKNFGHLDQEKLNWKSNPQSWSIAQNIDHLIVINESYFPIFHAINNGTYQKPFLANLGFLANLMGKVLLKSVQPDNKIKTQTFDIWEPSKSRINKDIIPKLIDHHEKLKAHIDALNPFIEKGIIIASPANKYIIYKLETAFDIIITHELRHLKQAFQVLSAIKVQTDL